MEHARDERYTSGQRQRPVAPGEDQVYPRMRNLLIPLQLQQPGDENRDSLGRYRLGRCENPNPTG